MTKTVVTIALVLGLAAAFGSCEVADSIDEIFNPNANCDSRETAAQSCVEYTGLASTVAGANYQEACLGTWSSGICNRTGMRGGCQSELSETLNLTVTTWTLGTPGSPEAQAAQAACESATGTWVQP